IETRPSAAEAARVEQRGYVVARAHKAAALGRILDVESPDAAIVFCRTRTEVDQLTELLNGRGYRAEALHGGMNQEARDRVMGRVRNGTADLLIATDVAARGLDIDLLTHVVNYDVPSAPESYVHRIGRVGRAGREGVAITLVEPREHRQLADIQRATSDAIRIEKIPSVADVNERRMGQTIDALRSAMEDSDELDHYRAVIDELSAEADLFDIALAAVRLAHGLAGTVENEQEIPEVELRRDRPDRRTERVDRGPGRPTRSDRGQRDGGRRDGGRRDGDRRDAGRRGRSGGRDMTRLYFPIGRSSRVGPGDLVGAIAGETRLSGNDIGSIEVTDRFSLVEVPTESVDEVLGAMARTTIRGRRAAPRRERFERR
ncbi:MAG: helicase-related protein, partial [Acidimicrobiia bacterium]